ncbi:MAG: trigger factor [Leptospirales bacterium]
MDVQIEKGNGNLHSFTVGLSAEEIQERVKGKIRAVNSKLKVPGYRSGHVPEPVVRRNKDLIQSIHQEVLDDVLNAAYDELLKKAPGTVVHLQPSPVTLGLQSEREGLHLKGEVEIFEIPEGLSPFGIALSPAEELSVSEEEIRTEKERLQVVLSNQFREDLPADTPIELSDFVRFRIHFTHPSTGETFDSEQIAEVGGDQVPEAFTRALLEKKVGETVQVTLPLNVPDSRSREGSRVEVHPAELGILEIQRRIPLSVEDLILKVFPSEDASGGKTEADLIVDVEKGLLGQKVLKSLEEKRRELRKEVLASWGIPAPEKRLAREYERLGLQSEAEREEYRQVFQWQLFLDTLLEREKIEPDWETVGQEYRGIMRSQGETPSQKVDRDALTSAMQSARRIKLEEMMLREAQFGASELFFGEEGYLAKVGMSRFGKKPVPHSEEEHDHTSHEHNHPGHSHESSHQESLSDEGRND